MTTRKQATKKAAANKAVRPTATKAVEPKALSFEGINEAYGLAVKECKAYKGSLWKGALKFASIKSLKENGVYLKLYKASYVDLLDKAIQVKVKPHHGRDEWYATLTFQQYQAWVGAMCGLIK